MKYDLAASTQLLAVLQDFSSPQEANSALWELLQLSNERIDNMPYRVHRRLIAALTGGGYGYIADDVAMRDATVSSPVIELSRAIERVIPTIRVSNPRDFEPIAARLFQRLKERNAPLRWNMLHPRIDRTPMYLSAELLERGFALQQVLGMSPYASYPVLFALNYPVACVAQVMYDDVERGLRQLTVLQVVPTGLLRLVALPHYMLGYGGYDGLVWMQKGFRVKVGGLTCPLTAPRELRELLWQLSDYQWQRRVATSPTTGVVIEHNARVLTH